MNAAHRRLGRRAAVVLAAAGTVVALAAAPAAAAPVAEPAAGPAAGAAAAEPAADPAAGAAADPAAAEVAVDVVTVNDFHGRIEADGAAAGAAALAGAVAEVRAANPNTIFAAAGDLIGASTFTSFIQDDNPTIDALNAAGLDVSAAGNHEFDRGWADLRDRVQQRADWEYLSSNVFLTETGQPALAPSWVSEQQGVRVGFVGAVTEDLPSLVSPDGIAELEVRSIPDAVNAAAAALRDGDQANGEADVVILLVHEGAETVDVGSITQDSPLGEIVYGVDDDVDAIVSAHTHLAYNHVIDGRPVVSAGQYGENFGLMRIVFDTGAGELSSITNEVKPLTRDDEPLYPADPEVQRIVDDAVAVAEVEGAKPVGEITATMARARQGDGSENRGGESTLGNFVADVQREATGADIAFMNPGGLRADLDHASTGEGDPDGNVSYREAATVQPFANTLVTMSMTGEQIERVLEEQWQPAEASRPFLKLGVSAGLEYTYDPNGDQGERLSSVRLNGTALDPAASYSVVANSFLAAGGDNFVTFADAADRADSGKIDLESMVDWFRAFGTASPDLAQRAVGVVLSPPAGDGYVEGEQLTVELSSLAFTAGEDAPAEAAVSLGAEPLVTAAVDPAPVDTTDEAGTASLSLTLPAGVTGDQELRVVAGETEIAVPIRIEASPAAPASIAVDPAEATAGETVAVTGSGFAPGAELTVQLWPEAVALGSVTARDDGSISTEVTVPAETAPGEHALSATDAAGELLAQTPLTVLAAQPAPSPVPSTPATPPPAGPGGDLPATGMDVAGVVVPAALAALLLLAGTGLILARRRTPSA